MRKYPDIFKLWKHYTFNEELAAAAFRVWVDGLPMHIKNEIAPMECGHPKILIPHATPIGSAVEFFCADCGKKLKPKDGWVEL